MAPNNQKKKTKTGRPQGTKKNVPGTQRALMVRPGVDLKTKNRYVPYGANQEFCQCGEVSGDHLCNAVISNKGHSLTSHISTKHRNGRYAVFQAPENWQCQCGSRKLKNFHSTIGHIRRAHGYRGSSKMFEKISNKTIRVRKDNTVIVPNDEGEYEDKYEDEYLGDDDLVDECGGVIPALPKEKDDDDDENGSGGGHGFGLGQAQAVEVGN